jgi:SAM-dependent methyltransferase
MKTPGTPVDFARAGRIVFGVSVVSGVAQVSILRELAAADALATLALAIRLMLAVVLAAYGVGAALAPVLRGRDEARVFSGLGLGVSLYLAGLLFGLLRWLDPGAASGALEPARLALLAAAVAPPFVGFGLVTAHLTARVQASTPERVGPLVAIGIGGTALGLVACHHGAGLVGINGLLLLAALAAWPTLTNRPWVALAATAAIALLPVDARLEELRSAEPGFYAPISARNTTQVYSGWSPHQKIDLYTFEDEVLLGFHNGFWQWWTAAQTDHPHAFPGYRLLYDREWVAGRDVLVIGSGAGMGLLHLEQAQPRSISAVEIDPLVVELSRKSYARFNDSVYERVAVHVQEGRAHLDGSDQRFDLIIYEGSFLTGAHPRVPVSAENHLYTREGLRVALDHLGDSGIGLVLFAGPDVALARVREAARAEGAHVSGLHLRYPGTLWWNLPVLVFGRDAAAVDRVVAKVRAKAGSHARVAPLRLDAGPVTPATDRRPFLYMPELQALRPLALGCAGAATMLLGALVPTRRRRLGGYFALIGAGFVLVQYGLQSHLRSFLGDPVTTAYAALLLLLGGMALGSAKLEASMAWRPPTRWVAAVGLVALSTCLLVGLPFHWSNAAFGLRLAVVSAALVPLGMVLGAFFPLGLRGEDESAAPAAYAWDAAGAVLGFGLFHLIAMPMGIPATLLAGGVAYLGALGLQRWV